MGDWFVVSSSGREPGTRSPWPRLAPVATGGAAGTLVRAGSDAVLGPWSTVVVDLLGAFALGVLLEALARRPAAPGGTRVRLVAGTGFLGAFTTYGTVAVRAAEGLAAAPVSTVLGVLALLLGGALSAAAGAAVGAALSGGLSGGRTR